MEKSLLSLVRNGFLTSSKISEAIPVKHKHSPVSRLQKGQVINNLEPSCFKKRQKSPNQESGLGNMKVLKDTKLMLSVKAHAPEPLDVLYSLNQFFGWDFFCYFLQQDISNPALSIRTDLYELFFYFRCPYGMEIIERYAAVCRQ